MRAAIVRASVRVGPVLVLCAALGLGACLRRSGLPHSLSDRDYWSLIESLSETGLHHLQIVSFVMRFGS